MGNTFANVVELNAETGEEDAALTADPRLTVACRLPRDETEIAITDYHADMFMRFGYRDADGDGAVCEIDSPDDLIGKTVGGLTICGVYATGEDKEWFRKNYDFENTFDQSNPDYADYSPDYYIRSVDDFVYTWMQGEHVMKYAFVCEGFYKRDSGLDLNGYNVLYRLSGDVGKDKALLQRMTFDEDRVVSGQYTTTYKTIHYAVAVKTGYSGFTDQTDFLRQRSTVNLSMYISMGFAIVSALALMTFLSAGADARQRESGILRALGARRADIAFLCLTESLFIAAIDFVLSLTAIGVICAILNARYYLPLFMIGVVPVAALFAVCFGAALVASVLPVIKTMSKSPIEAIRSV